jgi:diguanylate cyclase (GGDEF)-like protein
MSNALAPRHDLLNPGKPHAAGAGHARQSDSILAWRFARSTVTNMTPEQSQLNNIVRLASPIHPLKVILIEDCEGDAILIERTLRQAMPDAHSVERATTIATALKLVSGARFDVALLDRSLPDVEGFGGLRNIQTMSPELPVIFLTAYQDELTAFDAIRQGAQDYLFKDRIDPHVIKRAIQYAVLRKQFESVLIVQANYDLLTGLANRMLFENRLDLALAKLRRLNGNLGVLFLDVDRFKTVNDRLGHVVGDRLLQQIGKCLTQVLRSYDTVARFGGDEFAILLEAIPDSHHSEVVAEKIIRLFEQPFDVAGFQVDVGISIGISVCGADQEYTRDIIMQQADTAMYEAKARAGSAYCVFLNLAEDSSRVSVG